MPKNQVILADLLLTSARTSLFFSVMPLIKYDNFDHATLMQYVRRLTHVCKTIESVAQQMEELEIDILPIYNADILKIGTGRVENFATAATRSMGDFVADPDDRMSDELNAEQVANRRKKRARLRKAAASKSGRRSKRR